MDILLSPWNWWVEPFLNNTDLRMALFASILTVICASTIGTWVVLRGISFFADALAHGVLPGVGIAMALGGNTTLGAFIAAIVMIGGIRTVRRLSPLPNDTSIGLLFVGLLALTLVVVGGDEEGDEALHELLFGNVLETNGGDLILLGVSAFIILAASVTFYRAFLATTFDFIFSRLLNLRPELVEMGLLLLVSLALISSFKALGSLLFFALLIAPPASAALVCKKAWMIMLVGGAQGVLSVVLGLLISFHYDTVASSSVALTSVAFFFVSLVLKLMFEDKPILQNKTASQDKVTVNTNN